MEKLGFIGLGDIGFGMAMNLAKAGNYVMVANRRRKEVVDKLVSCGAVQATKDEIAEQCDVLFICVTNGDVTRQVLFGEDGLAAKMKSGSIVVEHGSVSYLQSLEDAKKLAEYGIGYVDCPVSGTETKALDGTLAMMAGGNEEDYNRVLPYFNATGIPMLMGPVGSGSLTKYICQTICSAQHIIFGETMHLADVVGIDKQKIYDCIKVGAASSFLLDRNMPMIINEDFPQDGTITILRKDMYNVLQTCHELHVSMPVTAQMYEIYNALSAMGLGETDVAGVIKYYQAIDSKTGPSA